MFLKLGIGRGVSLLGGLSVLGIVSTIIKIMLVSCHLELTELNRLAYGCCISSVQS